MPSTTATTELTHISCWCGTPMALPKNLVRNAQEHGSDLWCPGTGHRFTYDSENEKLRKQLEHARTRTNALLDQLGQANRETRDLKSKLTKERKRTSGGVCPCCQRSFVQLARHMKNKHPDFAEVPV